ncbi:MAG: hypothetical protein NTY61_02255, partial [Candidatus Parcubacteria bacterium]|nr:hypothetical protein [Candidatus Parcubacteria bacterium]
MTNLKEQPGPNQEKNRLLEKAVRKIAQTIKQENFKITPLVADRLQTAVNELGTLEIETAPDAILISAIEAIAILKTTIRYIPSWKDFLIRLILGINEAPNPRVVMVRITTIIFEFSGVIFIATTPITMITAAIPRAPIAGQKFSLRKNP